MNKTNSESRFSPLSTGAKMDGNQKPYWDQFIDSIGDPLLVMDRQHHWVSINEAACEFMGARREDILGKTVHDLLPGEEAEECWSKTEEVFKTGRENIHEGKITDARGAVHTIILRERLQRDEKGDKFIVTAIQDITQQKTAETQLAYERQLLNALFDASPDDIYFKDRASHYIRCSSSMARRFKAKAPEELIGKTDHDFLTEEHARQTFEEEQEIIRTGKAVRGKTQKEIWSDGRQTWSLTTKLPFRNAKGETIGTMGISKDITWNILNAEQLRSQAAMLDITQEAMYVRDFSGRIIYWNEGASHLYGWSMDEVRERTIKELNLALDPDVAFQALETVREHNEWNGELRQKNRAGREVVVQSHWNLIRKHDGTPKAILVLNTDITKKRELEVQLLRAQRLESIGTLSSGLAHDLNNVLAPIMMSVELLKECATNKDTLGLLQTLETCTERGANIIRQMLMFARGLKGQRVKLDPKHLVQEMERIAHEIFPRSIEIQVSTSKEPCSLMGDPTQIQQVLMNLCVNARDAMPQGGTLKVSLKPTRLDETTTCIHPKAQPGTYVVISVTDTGTGIPPELKEKIFDPFFTTKQPGHGTGLGLSIVLGIVEHHGGFVLVESQPGKGSSFHVYLPSASDDDKQKNGDIKTTVLAKGNGEVVLVVDDESAILSFATALLKNNGYKTLVAANGQEGLKVFKQQHKAIDLVVCDLIMPHLDGIKMVQELRRVQPDIKAILISGLGEEKRLSEARAAGIDLILHKPFTAEQLLTRVKKALNSNPQASPPQKEEKAPAETGVEPPIS